MLKRLTINRIDPVSAGKILGIIGAVLGVFGAFIMGLFLLVELSANQGYQPGGGGDLIFAGMFVVLAPFVYGVGGFISGLLTAIIHNTAARLFGGLVLEVEDDSEDDEP